MQNSFTPKVIILLDRFHFRNSSIQTPNNSIRISRLANRWRWRHCSIFNARSFRSSLWIPMVCSGNYLLEYVPTHAPILETPKPPKYPPKYPLILTSYPFPATRHALLRFHYLDAPSLNDRIHASTIAGGITGGSIGGLISIHPSSSNFTSHPSSNPLPSPTPKPPSKPPLPPSRRPRQHPPGRSNILPLRLRRPIPLQLPRRPSSPTIHTSTVRPSPHRGSK